MNRRVLDFMDEWNRKHTSYPTCEDAIDWADEHPKSPWIECSERLPETDKMCLCYNTDGFADIYTFKLDNKVFTDFDYYNDTEVTYQPITDIIAWMPIPKYKEE